MNFRDIHNVERVFHKYYQLAPCFFSGFALIDKTLVLFAADISSDLIHAVLCVYAYLWHIGIISPWELAPHQVNSQSGEAFMFDIVFICLLSAVLYDPHG